MVQYALSLKQPWAELILLGRKVIETRKWNTKFRGEFLIHASKQIDLKACSHFKMDPKSLTTGAIVGKAKLVSTKEYATPEEFTKDNAKHAAEMMGFSKPKFGFNLREIQRLKPRSCKGALGFFKVNL